MTLTQNDLPRQGKTKKKEAQEAVVYVPNDILKNESFRRLIPNCGVRYYITKEPMDAENIINDIEAMQDEEKEDVFSMIIFDISLFGQMGIVSNCLGEKEIKKLLS